jgi:hypothetical protein
MSGGGGTAEPDEATELRAFIRKKEAELEGIQAQVDKLKAALDKEPFDPVGRLKTTEAANAELQRLYAKEATTQKLIDGYNQRLLLLQQAAAGGCTYYNVEFSFPSVYDHIRCATLSFVFRPTNLLRFVFTGNNAYL